PLHRDFTRWIEGCASSLIRDATGGVRRTRPHTPFDQSPALRCRHHAPGKNWKRRGITPRVQLTENSQYSHGEAMPSRGIALNATSESSSGTLWPVPPRSHKLFLLAQHGAKVELWNRPNKKGWTPLRITEGIPV